MLTVRLRVQVAKWAMPSHAPSYHGYRFPSEIISKAAEEARVSSPSARHRQAAQLPGGPSNRDAIGSPSDREVCEQPSRGVASTDAAARAPNATLQVSRPSAAVRGRPRRDAQSVPSRPTPASINSPPLASPPSVRRVGGGDVCLLTDGEDICNRGTRLSSIVQLDNALRPNWLALVPAPDTLPRPLRTALDHLDLEIRKLHKEAALAA